jgi:hypothetical protein
MKPTPVPFALILLLATLASADEAPSDTNAFNTSDFDASVQSSTASEEQSKLRYEPGLFFVAEVGGHTPDTAKTYGADMRFYGKASLKAVKPDFGSLFLGYSFNYFLFASSHSPSYGLFYRRQSPDHDSLSAKLAEFHYSFDIRKRIFIRIGEQLISWGATYFWSPADLINRQKAQASVLSAVDLRTGKPGLRLHIPIRKANLFLFSDFSRVVRNNRIYDIAKTMGQAWRADCAIGGVQLGFNGYASKDRPVQTALDATGRLLGNDLYAECALTMPAGREPDFSPAASAGGARVFGQEQTWTARGEFYFNDNGYGRTKISKLMPGEFTPFYSGKYYAYAEISTTKLLTSDISGALYGFMNVADLSYSATLQFSFDFPGIVPFLIYGRYYGGDTDREFTSGFGGRTWQAGIRVTAEL